MPRPARAQELAAVAGVQVEHIAKAHIRKEDVVAKVLARGGDHPGLVHVISAMQACQSYKPWHDKASGKTFLKPDTGKCLHYYFYFIDPMVGLCYLRVPTWCPFRLQFYCNGHGWLAQKLKAKRIDFTLEDNAFVRLADITRAQALADSLKPDQLHRVLDRYARQCCPVQKTFGQRYHWSLMQVEYATDLVFRSREALAPLYEQLSRQSVLAVKAEQVASFLGKKITPQLAQEVGSRFATRIEGTCIKHRLGKAQVKMYDKFGLVLRIETTVNDVSFFKHHRKVEHRQGRSTWELAPLKKSIYSLIDLREILLGRNRRYLEFLSALDDHSAGLRALDRLTEEQREGDRPIKGLNFFKRTEQHLLRAPAAAVVQYPRRAPRRPHRFAPRILASRSLAPAAPPARYGRDQTRRGHLSLLPHTPRSYRHRRRLLDHRAAARSSIGCRAAARSLPFRSRVKS